MEKCIFCKIIKKEISSDTVYESENVLAFRDIDVQAPTHILVIPKEHVESVMGFDKENSHIFSEMGLAAKEISIQEGISNKGFRWVINTGQDGGQTVDHIHLHIMGGRQMSWPPG